MVFRGKPSQACQRCRNRRLKVRAEIPHVSNKLIYASQCDLAKPACSSCIRARVQCLGYRNNDTLRVADQTDFVRTKALARAKPPPNQLVTVPKLQNLPQDLQVLSRDLFFAHYVSDFSRMWDFLLPYVNTQEAPDHLKLSIDAVSLAFLSHQVSSSAAKNMGRQRYSEALTKIKRAVSDPVAATRNSTFEGALLLDLYERIAEANSETSASRHAHIAGALALVKLRGIENFHDGSELKTLLGLSLNATICALSNGTPVPVEVHEIRAHAAQFVDTSYPKWKMNDCVLEVSALPAMTRDRNLTPQERISRSAALDRRMATIALEAAPAWSYERKFVCGHDPRICVPDGFPVYDVYPDRKVTQMWNVLRLTRILLCEEIIGLCAPLQDEESTSESQRAKLVIAEMVREICASCPQMMNCDLAARHKLPSGAMPGVPHTHKMSHILDVYVLLFALYVVAWSRNCPPAAREWAIDQLAYIAEHFGIREAALVWDMLRRNEIAGVFESWYVTTE